MPTVNPLATLTTEPPVTLVTAVKLSAVRVVPSIVGLVRSEPTVPVELAMDAVVSLPVTLTVVPVTAVAS